MTSVLCRQAAEKKALYGKTEVEDVVSELRNMVQNDPGSDFVIGYNDVDNDDPLEGKKRLPSYFYP